MGTIGSRHQEIQGIDIRPWPTKPVAGVRVVRVDLNTVIGVGANGAVYCTHLHQKVFYAFPWRGSVGVLRALAELGRIPQAAYEQHVQELSQVSERKDRAYDASRILLQARELALPLTKAQERKLVALMKADPDVERSHRADFALQKAREEKRAAKGSSA